MKKIIFLIVTLVFAANVSGQSIQITAVNATPVSGGINVNLRAISFNGAGFLDHYYTITGNTVELTACYWFNLTLPVLEFENDFFVPLENPGNYTVNVRVYNSSNWDFCDYFSLGDTATTSVLSVSDFENAENNFALFPNPSGGIVSFSGIVDQIRIYDAQGKLVKQFQNLTDNKIDLADLNPGIYLFRMEVGQNTVTKKIIRN